MLEKADNVYVLPSDFGWSDLGTWKSVQEQFSSKGKNKSLKAIVHSIRSKDNLVVTQSEKLVVLKDIEGYFVIDTDDALLICKSDQEQEIKKIASDIKKKYKGRFG